VTPAAICQAAIFRKGFAALHTIPGIHTSDSGAL
jgi:hypothetical protein